MLFNTLHFGYFFILVAALFFALPRRQRWIFLLLCNFFYYFCFKAEYLILLIIAIDLLRNGFKLGEVPILMKEREHGASSITGLDTLLYMIKVIFAIIIVKIRRRR